MIRHPRDPDVTSKLGASLVYEDRFGRKYFSPKRRRLLLFEAARVVRSAIEGRGRVKGSWNAFASKSSQVEAEIETYQLHLLTKSGGRSVDPSDLLAALERDQVEAKEKEATHASAMRQIESLRENEAATRRRKKNRHRVRRHPW